MAIPPKNATLKSVRFFRSQAPFRVKRHVDGLDRLCGRRLWVGSALGAEGPSDGARCHDRDGPQGREAGNACLPGVSRGSYRPTRGGDL